MIGIFKKSRIPLSYAKFRSRNNCVSLKFRPEFLVLSFEINKAEFLLVFFDFCQNTFIFFFNFQSHCCGYGIDGHGMIFFSVHLPLSYDIIQTTPIDSNSSIDLKRNLYFYFSISIKKLFRFSEPLLRLWQRWAWHERLRLHHNSQCHQGCHHVF